MAAWSGRRVLILHHGPAKSRTAEEGDRLPPAPTVRLREAVLAALPGDPTSRPSAYPTLNAMPAGDSDDRRSRLIPWDFLPDPTARTPDFCIESDPEGWDRAVREMMPAVHFLRSVGVQFLAKYDGNRSLHVVIPHDALPPGGYAVHLALCRVLREQAGLGCYVHLLRQYTVPFALHRSTGLAALPLLPEEIAGFRPWQASVDQVRVPDWWPPHDPDGMVRSREVLSRLLDGSACAACGDGHDNGLNGSAAHPTVAFSPGEAREFLDLAASDAPPGRRWLALENLLCGRGLDLPTDGLARVLVDGEEIIRAAAAELCRRMGARCRPAVEAALRRASAWRELRNVSCLAQELGMADELAGVINAARERVLPDSALRTSKYHDLDDPGRLAVLRLDAEDPAQSAAERARALHIIGVAGLRAALDVVIGALGNRDPLMRRTAAQALGMLGTRDDVGHLDRVSEDRSSGVRSWQAWARGRIAASAREAGPRRGK